MKRILAVFVASLLASVALGQTSNCATPGTDNSFLNIQTVRLWPGDAPEARGKECKDVPALTILNPRRGTENGTAVIVLPGGGYAHLAGDLEGRQVADWFTARGVKAFVLSYRLTSDGYVLPVPLLDARRAVQQVRAHAAEYHVNPNRIVIAGFSAGGHLSALAGTRFVEGKPDAADPVERVSSRPDFMVLGYPWLGAVDLDTTHLNYCKVFQLMDKCAELHAAYSPDLYVTKNTPPTFIYHTTADQTVPVEQSVRFYQALLKNGVPAEMHIFASGGHGSGLGKGDPALDEWPALLENWLRAQGLFAVEKK